MRFREIAASVGILRVGGEFAGTAFLIPVSPPDPVVVTATHVVIEAIRRPVAIDVTFGGKTSAARVIASRPMRPHGDDVALLKLDTDGDIPSPIACSFRNAPGPGLIFGYPGRMYTKATAFDLSIKGEEVTSSEQRVLAFSSPEIQSDPHSKIRGMSGSPLAARIGNDNYLAVGVFGRIEEGGFAGRGYCTPMSVVADLCVLAKMRLLPQDDVSSVEFDATILKEVLSGLEVSQRELYAWSVLSSLFFQGVPIDVRLRELLDRRSKIEGCDRVVSEYLYAKLLLKRGDLWNGLPALRHASDLAKQSSAEVSGRISALCASRDAAQQRFSTLSERKRVFGISSSQIESACMQNQSYGIYELASTTGLEAMQWFEHPSAVSEELHYIASLVDRHHALTISNPGVLDRQLVTSNALRVLLALWNNQFESIPALIEAGFAQSRADRNSIYFLQMLIAQGLHSLRRSSRMGVALLILVGRLCRDRRLTSGHEGIRHLTVFMRKFEPEAAATFLSVLSGHEMELAGNPVVRDAFQLADIWALSVWSWEELFMTDYRLFTL